MAAIPEDKLVLTNFKNKLLFKKKLTKSDLERLFVNERIAKQVWKTVYCLMILTLYIGPYIHRSRLINKESK
jgi:hypothetical protein